MSEIIRSIKLHIGKILKNHKDANSEKKWLKALSHAIVAGSSTSASCGINVTTSYNFVQDLSKHLVARRHRLVAAVRPFYPEMARLADGEDDGVDVARFLSLWFSGDKEGNGGQTIGDIGDEYWQRYREAMAGTIGAEMDQQSRVLICQLCHDLLASMAVATDCRRIASNVASGVAPNLSALLRPDGDCSDTNDGDNDAASMTAAKLIASAGSLKKLAELPSSTIHTLTVSDALLR